MDSKFRFTDRVDAYMAARPSYPAALLKWMRNDLELAPEHIIADIGSGTGLLSRLMLEGGNRVIGVEPNDAMREAGDRFLTEYQHFRSVAGCAEATTLAEKSVDFITAGQAFHWFQSLAARCEFDRIARPGCWAVFVWNEVRVDGSELSCEYELLKDRFARDDHPRRRNATDGNLELFFGQAGFQIAEFHNPCRYTLEQFQQRAASSSYMPSEGDPNFEPMQRDLAILFERHVEDDGAITYDHDTRAYYGRIA
jgi:SAM-dependent methyltransferase